MAPTQAARRQPADIEAPQATRRVALIQAAAQTRCAADIVKRLHDGVKHRGTMVEDVGLMALLRGAAHLRQPELPASGIVLCVPLGDAPPPQADRVTRRELARSVRADADEVRLVVADNGSGIAPDLLSRLFQPFVSAREGGGAEFLEKPIVPVCSTSSASTRWRNPCSAAQGRQTTPERCDGREARP